MNVILPILSLFACCLKGSYVNSRSDLVELGSNLCGADQVVFVNDSGYATAKLQHVEVFQYEPFAVLYATCENDVVEFINFVNSVDGINFRIRTGGHSFGGYSNCDDCIILDLSRMNDASMDPASKTATLGPGVDNEDLVRFMTANGRMVPHGFCLTVCMGGLGQVGGTSLLTRSLGLVVDYIESVNIVTADGTSRVCSYDDSVEDQSLSENGCSDLLWALRGSGGGQWGVITSYTLRTMELAAPHYTYGYVMGFPVTNTSLRHFAQWTNNEFQNNTLDASLGFGAVIVNSEFVPGTFMLIINGVWYGADYAYGRQYVADELVAEFSRYDGFFLQEFLNMTYHEFYSSLSADYAEPPATHTASRLIFEDGLNDVYVDAMLDYLNGLTSDTSSFVYQGYAMTILFEYFNEATQNDTLTLNTSFPNRDMLAYTVLMLIPPNLEVDTLTESDALCADFDSRILSLLSDQTYVGYKDAYQTNWQEHYFGRQPELYTKLTAIKEKNDPNNLFNDGVAFVSSIEESDSAANIVGVSLYSLFLACVIACFFSCKKLYLSQDIRLS